MTDSPDIFRNDHTVLKRCKHGYFLFNRKDLFVGRALDLYGEWCEQEIASIAQLVRSGDVVVDVGANIGTHTLALANMVTAAGMVIAVEAQRMAYNYLVANVALNNLMHVLCLNNAAGEGPGTVLVPLLSPAVPNNFGAMNVSAQETGEPVQVVTIDSLGLTRCNLIKIDVEGMEPQVLRGAEHTIQTLRPAIFVEATLVNTRDVVKVLSSFGYDCYWHVSDYFNPDNFFLNSDNVFAGIHPESNLVCFPRESHVVVSGLEPATGPDDNWQHALERMRKKQRPGQ